MDAFCDLCGHRWRDHEDGACVMVRLPSPSAPIHDAEPCPCGHDLEWMKGRILERALAVMEANVIRPEETANYAMGPNGVAVVSDGDHFLPGGGGRSTLIVSDSRGVEERRDQERRNQRFRERYPWLFEDD